MAVIDDCPGLKVEIDVDGSPLPEYDDNEERAPRTSNKYIPARSGKAFTIRVTCSLPIPIADGIEMRMNIDDALKRTYHERCHIMYQRQVSVIPGVDMLKDGKWYRQTFRFTALNIVEETDGTAELATLKKQVQSKGCITIAFRYTTNIRDSNRPHRGHLTTGMGSLGAIPEKALKGDARSHQATLSDPIPIPSPTKPRLEYDYLDKNPFATFHFKYRSQAALKALQIVTDDQSSTPAMEEHPGRSSRLNGLGEIAQIVQQYEGGEQIVKQERVRTRPVKREHATTLADSDDEDVTIVETRTRKRTRGEVEVIVLD